jgi:mRNA-degrading endonuclease RelE of RelBE toxin-antitoxin system
MLYGSKRDVYRVIYDIDEARKLIRIRTVRHTAMDDFKVGR